MIEEERAYEQASRALGELIAKDVALETESIVVHDAGDYARSNAAEAARAALPPSILKAEEQVYRANIARHEAVKANVSHELRREAVNASPQQVEELVRMFTSTFDDDVRKIEQQLANNLEEQAHLSRASNSNDGRHS